MQFVEMSDLVCIEQLIGRASGPLQFRLVVMPTVGDAAGDPGRLEGCPGKVSPRFCGESFPTPAGGDSGCSRHGETLPGFSSWRWCSTRLYQLMVLRAFYVVQALIVAVTCAIVPYVLFRGPATRLARVLSGKQAGPTNSEPVAKPAENTEGPPETRGHTNA